jgi:hypothetical protein
MNGRNINLVLNKSSGERKKINMCEIKIDVMRAVLGGCLAKKSVRERSNYSYKVHASGVLLVGIHRARACRTVIILIGGWWVASAGGYQAYQLFKTILPTTRSFSSTVITALSTILALMLTLLGLSASLVISIKTIHYHRIKQISMLITISLIVAVLAYLLLNIPITESEQKTLKWF